METPARGRMDKLESLVREVCQEYRSAIPFHGWHHVAFVRSKAVEYARKNAADGEIVEAAALVHDLNYIVEKNSDPQSGESLRRSLLAESGFVEDERVRIESVISEAHTATRGPVISPEGRALSDADTLFKVVPITPVVFSYKYMEENEISLRELARKIVDEQVPLLEGGIYFYDPDLRDRYLPWAEAGLTLWRRLLESLDDPDVGALLTAVDVPF